MKTIQKILIQKVYKTIQKVLYRKILGITTDTSKKKKQKKANNNDTYINMLFKVLFIVFFQVLRPRMKGFLHSFNFLWDVDDQVIMRHIHAIGNKSTIMIEWWWNL